MTVMTKQDGPHVPTTMTMTPAARPAQPRRWPARLAWALAGLTVLTLAAGFWLAELLWSTGWEPRPSNAIAVVGAVILVTVSTATVGAVLASRRPHHPVGWLLLGVGLALNLSLLVQSYVKYGLLARPGSLPAARYLAWVHRQHRADLAVVRWVRAAADPDRVAAVAPLALVGQGGGGRAGGGGAGVGRAA